MPSGSSSTGGGPSLPPVGGGDEVHAAGVDGSDQDSEKNVFKKLLKKIEYIEKDRRENHYNYRVKGFNLSNEEKSLLEKIILQDKYYPTLKNTMESRGMGEISINSSITNAMRIYGYRNNHIPQGEVE